MSEDLARYNVYLGELVVTSYGGHPPKNCNSCHQQ
jgi:hypothetical protein